MQDFQTWVFISMEKKELLQSVKENTDQHRPVVACSHTAPFSALLTV